MTTFLGRWRGVVNLGLQERIQRTVDFPGEAPLESWDQLEPVRDPLRLVPPAALVEPFLLRLKKIFEFGPRLVDDAPVPHAEEGGILKIFADILCVDHRLQVRLLKDLWEVSVIL